MSCLSISIHSSVNFRLFPYRVVKITILYGLKITNIGLGNENLAPDLQNTSRQSRDYLTIMPESRSTYDGRLIYKTSHEDARLFLGTRFTCMQNCKIV